MKTRVGKIARLPESIRTELNEKLFDGNLGKTILSWLNALPEVNEIMAAYFNGRPITHQNISEWRVCGYQDWLRERETQERVFHLAEKFQNLEPEERLRRAEGMIVSQLLDAVNHLHEIPDPDARWRRFQRICWEMARMQKQHCRGMELLLQQHKAFSAARACSNSQPLHTL